MLNLLKRLTRCVPVGLVLLGLSFAAVSNAAIITPEVGTLSFFFLEPSGIGSVQGAAVLSYNDPAPVGFMITSDLGAAFPNSTLQLVNSTITESITLFFDTAGAQIIGQSLFVNSVGSPNAPLTDPILVAMLSAVTWQFDFVGNQLLEGDQILSQFDLVGAVTSTPSEVPEPGTWLLLSGGLVSIGLMRRRKRA